MIALYQRLIPYVRPYAGAWLIALLGYAIFASAQPLLALTMKYFVDGLNDPAQAVITLEPFGAMEILSWLPWLLVLITLWQGIGTLLGQYGMAKVAAGVVHDLRRDAFAHLMRLPLSYFALHDSGRTVSRLSHDVLTTTVAVTDAARILIREGLTVVALLGYLLWSNWLLTLALVAILPPLALLVRKSSQRMNRLARKRHDAIGSITGLTAEAVRGIAEIKAFGAEDTLQRRFAEINACERRQQEQFVQIAARQTVVTQLLTYAAMAFVLNLILMLRGSASIGDLVSYVIAAGLLPKPLRQLTELQSRLAAALAGASSVFALLDAEPEKDSDKPAPRNEPFEARATHSAPLPLLRLVDVRYRYPDAHEEALAGVSFELPAKGLIALVGRSGSGKSTVARLLLRFDDPQHGTIEFKGIPLTAWPRSELRAQIAYVPQQPVLFAGTVLDNLRLAAPGASKERCIEALKQAHAWEFVAKLSGGLDAMIGENGAALSGGQRQRLALARALLKKAPLLLLDEATSALDPASEAAIEEALEELRATRAILAISHRLSTVQRADRVILLEQGVVLAQGRHEELWCGHTFYRWLFTCTDAC